MKINVSFRWSAVAALAGFIFGFDTVVISGANLPVKALWNTTPLFHGFFIMSMALWGTLFGAVFGGLPTERFGRKKVLFSVGLLFTVSAIGTALAPGPYIFSVFRFIGGVGIGISSVVAPTYISEISTPGNRGRLGALYQFNIVFGILVAFLSNYLLQGVGGANDWRWMLGIMCIPSLLYCIMVTAVPESPRWLIARKNDPDAARKVLEMIGVDDPHAEITEIMRSASQDGNTAKANRFINRKYKTVISLSFWIAFFNQLSGINFILYYAPEILSRIGLGESDSLFNSIAIGGINLLFTFAGLYLIDRVGRRKLLIIGSLGYVISLAMVAACFALSGSAGLLLTFLLLFIAAHAIGQGAVIWVFTSEIFPNQVRASGQSFGASIHWMFAALITLLTPFFLDSRSGLFKDNPWPIFAFFAVMMVIQLVWVLVKVPETKGLSLEEIEQQLIGAENKIYG